MSRTFGHAQFMRQKQRALAALGVEFPIIERKRVPPGVVTVPVILHPHVPSNAIFVGGSMGMQVIEQEDDQTAAQPASGWWLLSAIEDPSIPPKDRPKDIGTKVGTVANRIAGDFAGRRVLREITIEEAL
ncbi:hypothetical protein SMAC4_00020 [Sordaria macrospora]|uniref:uncharacterized protein n=1 Tax=Sordaria macrospora TaxID=5147 RepID=UPI002B2E7144|nr:hypothetical protein SMAC4_00020 [Sordaria macrospora]